MRTDFLRLVQHTNDEALGSLVIDWIYTPIIRVTTNRIGRQQWEFVCQQGKTISPADLEDIRSRYPLAMFVHEVTA